MSKWITLNVSDFQQAFKRVSFAVAKEGDPKFSFTAICLLIEPKQILLMGSNSHRASIGRLEINVPDISSRQILVSPNSLAQIGRMFDQTFKLYLGKNSLIAKDDDNVLFMRLISGNFPNIKDYIPKYKDKVVLDADEFLTWVQKAALAVNKNSTLKLSFSKDSLKLSAECRRPRKSYKGDWKIAYGGKEIKFAVNCNYLRDVLKAADNTGIALHFGGSNQALLFTQPNFQYMMVPQEI